MIKPKSFLDFAQNLFNDLRHENDCIEVRSCISRAYYFIHHFGLQRFSQDKRAKNLSAGNTERHRLLIEFFRDIKARDIADRLNNLRNRRNDADYELNLNLTKKNAEDSLRDAKNLEWRMNRITPQVNQ